MGFAVSITRFSQYVQVTVSGPTSIKGFVDLVDTLGADTLFWSDRRVLADLRGVEGELTPTEQIFLGELVAQNLSHLERLASLVPPPSITRNSEGAAQELGMRLRVFTSKDDAVRWLTAGAESGVPEISRPADLSPPDSRV